MTIEGMRSIDPADLWDITTLTDLKCGEILIYTPVAPSGDIDAGRTTQFKGRTTLAGPAGQFPITFDLPGPTVVEALAGWGEACIAACAAFEKELEQKMLQARILQGAQQRPPAGGGRKQ